MGWMTQGEGLQGINRVPRWPVRSEGPEMAPAMAEVGIRRAAGAAWLAAAAIYLAAETASALRFTPSYSYAHDFISELGVTRCAPAGCSPLAGLMNFGFLAAGLLFILATALVFRALGRGRLAFTLLGVAHGTGLVLVATFHGGAAAVLERLAVFHIIGAVLAIFGGNLAIALSPVARSFGGPASLQTLGRILGVVGLVAVTVLSVTVTRRSLFLFDYGLWERLSVYTILLWEAVIGAWLLFAARRG